MVKGSKNPRGISQRYFFISSTDLNPLRCFNMSKEMSKKLVILVCETMARTTAARSNSKLPVSSFVQSQGPRHFVSILISPAFV